MFSAKEPEVNIRHIRAVACSVIGSLMVGQQQSVCFVEMTTPSHIERVEHIQWLRYAIAWIACQSRINIVGTMRRFSGNVHRSQPNMRAMHTKPIRQSESSLGTNQHEKKLYTTPIVMYHAFYLILVHFVFIFCIAIVHLPSVLLPTLEVQCGKRFRILALYTDARGVQREVTVC